MGEYEQSELNGRQDSGGFDEHLADFEPRAHSVVCGIDNFMT